MAISYWSSPADASSPTGSSYSWIESGHGRTTLTAAPMTTDRPLRMAALASAALTFDESAFLGKPFPVEKRRGDAVYGASVNQIQRRLPSPRRPLPSRPPSRWRLMRHLPCSAHCWIGATFKVSPMATPTPLAMANLSSSAPPTSVSPTVSLR